MNSLFQKVLRDVLQFCIMQTTSGNLKMSKLTSDLKAVLHV